MINFTESMVEWMDRNMEKGMRAAARTYGRRSFLTSFGAAIVGGAVLPMLPFDRSLGTTLSAESDQSDDSTCEYWAYCGMDGIRCNACGGSINQCPPGSEASKVSWVGTCTNPKDKKTYLVSYYDCCGKTLCQADATCSRHEGERPGYRIGTLSDLNWCMANASKGAHCSTAVIIGIADSE
jgi:methylamine dehydrogenase light chain